MVEFPIIDVAKTGENILRLRSDRNISVKEIRQYLGLEDPQAIYQWQRGISLPTVDHLYALSILFGVTMNEILVPADRTGRGEGNAGKRFRKSRCILLVMAAQQMVAEI